MEVLKPVYSVHLLQPPALESEANIYLCLLILTAGRKSCPLCPEEKFKACYSHKLRRHLQNLHWKVYVEFESKWFSLAANFLFQHTFESCYFGLAANSCVNILLG